MDMKALTTALLCCSLALAPVFASANDDSCECIADQVKATSRMCDQLEANLADYCPEPRTAVYGAIGYEMRYTDNGVEGDFDQRLRFAINYFNQLSDNLSLHVGISDRFNGLPNGDPFGFEQNISDIKRDMQLDTAYARYSR